jgi:hypothetical protein
MKTPIAIGINELARACADLIHGILFTFVEMNNRVLGEPEEEKDFPGRDWSDNFEHFHDSGPFLFLAKDLQNGLSYMESEVLSGPCRKIAEKILESPYRDNLQFHDPFAIEAGVVRCGRSHDSHERVSARIVVCYDIATDNMMARISCLVKKSETKT